MKLQASQREKILIIAAAVVFFVVVTAILWGPLLRSWRSASNQHNARRQQMKLVEETLAQQAEIETRYEQYRKTLASRSGSTAVPDALQKISALAARSGVNVRARTPQPQREQRGFTEVPIEYSLEASTETLVKFLYEVRVAQDLIDVTDLKIFPSPQKPETLRVEMRVVNLRVGQK